MDLESVADELYGISPDEFVAVRTERVKQARAEGDRPLAKEIGQLSRPTRSAWLVNVLAREAADELGALLELGVALSDAQRRLSGSDLRRLSSQRHAAVEALVRRAAELGSERGHTAAESTRLEVSQTLQAALADPATGRLVQTGRAIKSVTYGGFGPTEFLTAVPPLPPDEETPEEEAPAKKSAGKKSSEKQPAAKKDKEQERKRAEAKEAVTAATKELDQLREAQKSAESDLKQTSKSADELTELVSSLRDQLEEAKNSERAARESVRFARKQVQQLKEAAGDAETAVRQARDRAKALD